MHPPISVRSLFEQHADFVWRVLARGGVRDMDLKDALQEVFIVVTSKLTQLEPGIKPTTWLYGIAIRVAANHRRKVQRRREDLTGELIEPTGGPAPPDPEDQLLHAQARARLAALLEALPAEQRLVFELFELEELACPEIATKLEIPLGTVYTRLRAARAAIASEVRVTEGAT